MSRYWHMDELDQAALSRGRANRRAAARHHRRQTVVRTLHHLCRCWHLGRPVWRPGNGVGHWHDACPFAPLAQHLDDRWTTGNYPTDGSR